MTSKLLQLLLRYFPQARKKGGLFLFEPAKALELADGLNKIGVGIIAIELWYPTQDKTGLIEDPYGPEFDKLLQEPDGIDKSVQAAKHYLQHDLPERIVYVSYVLDTDERYWEAWQNELKDEQVAKAG